MLCCFPVGVAAESRHPRGLTAAPVACMRVPFHRPSQQAAVQELFRLVESLPPFLTDDRFMPSVRRGGSEGSPGWRSPPRFGTTPVASAVGCALGRTDSFRSSGAPSPLSSHGPAAAPVALSATPTSSANAPFGGSSFASSLQLPVSTQPAPPTPTSPKRRKPKQRVGRGDSGGRGGVGKLVRELPTVFRENTRRPHPSPQRPFVPIHCLCTADLAK